MGGRPKSLSLKCSSFLAVVCAPPATFLLSVCSLPTPGLPPSSPSSHSSPSFPPPSFCPPAARLPLSDQQHQQQTNSNSAQTTTSQTYLPCLALPYRYPQPQPASPAQHRNPYHPRPPLPYHPNPFHPILLSLRSSFTVAARSHTHFPFTCAAQPNSEPSIHHPSSIHSPSCSCTITSCTVTVLYCTSYPHPAHLTTVLAQALIPASPGRNSCRSPSNPYHTTHTRSPKQDKRTPRHPGFLVRLKKKGHNTQYPRQF